MAEKEKKGFEAIVKKSVGNTKNPLITSRGYELLNRASAPTGPIMIN